MTNEAIPSYPLPWRVELSFVRNTAGPWDIVSADGDWPVEQIDKPLADRIACYANTHDALVVALERYGRHLNCVPSRDDSCPCGFKEALRLARGETP